MPAPQLFAARGLTGALHGPPSALGPASPLLPGSPLPVGPPSVGVEEPPSVRETHVASTQSSPALHVAFG